jgi:arylsulfatase A-like enzyme
MIGKWLDRLSTKTRDRSNPPDWTPPPNIVWICADDFTPAVCGCYGNSIVRTPNLDRLSSQGMRFDRAYCTCPLSTPSRQSFWTGRYPRSIGVTLTPTPLPDDEVTLPAMLRSAGYEVASFGKTHYYCPRPQEFDLCVDLPEYEAWLSNARRTRLPAEIEVLGPWMPFASPAAEWLNCNCLPYGASDDEMCGTFFATQAARHLRAPKRRPFFLYVSFYETHSPFRFPIEFRGRYDPQSFKVPFVALEDQRRVPLIFEELSEGEKQGIQAAYATSTEFMDKNVGIVLDALEKSAFADNTLVIFTSDHGYLLGEHGRFEKHCCFEPAVRSALLMRLPIASGGGASSAAMVELIDVLPSILELCKVTLPSNVQGRSLLPLLRGEAASHREYVIAEYADNEEAMIRSPRWKLIYSTGNRQRRDGYVPFEPILGPLVQLFDLESDPEESINLANRPDKARLVRDLLQQLSEHMVRTARDPDLIPRSNDVHEILKHALPPHDVDTLAYLKNWRRRSGL